jgi:acyl carrier protein
MGSARGFHGQARGLARRFIASPWKGYCVTLPALRLTYHDPSGATHVDIAVDAVVARIRNAGPSYWNVGSGGATLHRGRAGSTARIDIYYVPRAGFHLIHHGRSKYAHTALPAQPPAKPRWTTIYVCGDGEEISTAQCITRAEAEAVLRQFAADGSMSPAVTWAANRPGASARGASGITARVKKIVARCLDVEPSEVTARARFIADLGADPLTVVELVMTIEEELGVEIPETAKITSLQDLLAIIAEAQG